MSGSTGVDGEVVMCKLEVVVVVVGGVSRRRASLSVEPESLNEHHRCLPIKTIISHNSSSAGHALYNCFLCTHYPRFTASPPVRAFPKRPNRKCSGTSPQGCHSSNTARPIVPEPSRVQFQQSLTRAWIRSPTPLHFLSRPQHARLGKHVISFRFGRGGHFRRGAAGDRL